MRCVRSISSAAAAICAPSSRARATGSERGWMSMRHLRLWDYCGRTPGRCQSSCREIQLPDGRAREVERSAKLPLPVSGDDRARADAQPDRGGLPISSRGAVCCWHSPLGTAGRASSSNALKYLMVVDLRTANLLRLTVPPSMLLSPDEVIE